MKALFGTVITFGIGMFSTAVALLIIRHIGPLQRLSGLVAPEQQILPLAGLPPRGGFLASANGGARMVNDGPGNYAL